MSAVQVDIDGLVALQRRLARLEQQVRPTGALGRAIVYGTDRMRQVAQRHTPVDTGALRHSHHGRTVATSATSITAQVAIKSLANPKSGTRTDVYGPIVHRKYRAFYGDAYRDRQPVVDEMTARIIKELDS